MTAIALPPLTRLPEGLDAVLHALQGRWRRRRRNAGALLEEAQTCLTVCESLRSLDDASLQQRIALMREALRRDPRNARGKLIDALATVGQIAWRSLGKQPYPVQFMGALALHRGWLAEMATGEGKTLTVSLAGVLAGWTGRPCHILTANDYLATRDAADMTLLYESSGVSVASIDSEYEPPQRMEAYRADVVYTTAKELLADHLRDVLAARSGKGGDHAAFEKWMGLPPQEDATPVLHSRGLHTAIIDEADSVLVDEAVTPLILSFPRKRPGFSEAVLWARDFADRLIEGEHFQAVHRTRSVALLPRAREVMLAQAHQLHPMWRPVARREEMLRHALTVRCFFHSGHQYLVHDDEIVLLDEFTGRMTPGRTLTAGLHQAIEAREGLELTDPNESMVQMSFQAFFRRFRHLAGTSGTAREASNELWRIFRLAVLPIPTHRPRQTVERPLKVLPTVAEKWRAAVEEIERIHTTGRPVLVGVRSVQASLELSQQLSHHGLEHSVLNAERHAEEAEMVSHAGELGRIMIATNMAGRGTDIHLSAEVKQLGGLHVVIAECNESARVDRQLAGRCGRQGDPGSVTRLLSLEDNLLRRYMSQSSLKVMRMLLVSGSGNLVQRLAFSALKMVQRRSEADAFSRRWSVLQSDDWMESALPFQADAH
jgi:preprotein translocase subunit SecA